jgi:hypothetical protein
MARFGLGSILGAGAAGAYGMQQINSQGFGSVMGRWFPNFEGVSMPQLPSVGQSAEVNAQPRTFLLHPLMGTPAMHARGPSCRQVQLVPGSLLQTPMHSLPFFAPAA